MNKKQVSAETIKEVSEKVYALWLKDVRVQKERRRVKGGVRKRR